MFNVGAFAKRLSDNWGSKTLEEFRVQAEREENGTCIESIRANGKQRLMIILCVTDIDIIAILERALDLIDDGNAEDWNTLTVTEVAMRAVLYGRFCFESIHDEYCRRSALVLIAADPDSIRIVEAIFKMPK